MAFVHLHNHTVFSMLDGATRIQDMVNRAVELGMPAVAITDHGYMYGVPDLALACDAVNHNTPEYKTWSHDKAFLEKDRRDELVEPDPEANPREHAQYVKDMAMWDEKGNIDELKPPLVIKPIFGCEAYFITDDCIQKGTKQHRYHLLLLAKNETGYVNLMKMMSEAASGEMFYYYPRTTLDMLRRYHEGIICSSACVSGIIPRMYFQGRPDEAKQWALTFRDIFGEDFYLEVQDHGLSDPAWGGFDDRSLSEQIVRLGRELGIKVIATNDNHYLTREDAPTQDILSCIGTASKVDDVNRKRMTGTEFYIKSEEEMRKLFSWCPEVIDNTLEVAAKCDYELDWTHMYLPKFPGLREGETSEQRFREECEKGLAIRYGEDWKNVEIGGWNVLDRLNHEYDIICTKGFADYFLIVQEYVQWAKHNGIGVGPGRGSAAGALVAYAMDITTFDPLSNGLMFERFLSPQRSEMPDIDMDFDDERRLEVVQHVRELYGPERVCHVITYSTIKAKQAINDACRVLGFPVWQGQKLSKMITNDPKAKLKFVLEKCDGKEDMFSPDFAEAYQKDADSRRIIDAALSIEGLHRGEGVHACAVLIAPTPVNDHVPTKVDTKGGVEITQYEGHSVADMGLLKMDFLGLRTLTVISKALANIRKSYPGVADIEQMPEVVRQTIKPGATCVDINVDKIPFDDPKIFELMGRGHTAGVFQIESAGMTATIKGMQPKEYRQVVALIALYRPGPLGAGMVTSYINRMNGKEPVAFYDDRLSDILDETYGTMVYQEQVMQISMKMSNFSPGESDSRIRKPVAKKKIKMLTDQVFHWEANGADETIYDHWINGAVENGYKREVAQRIWDDVLEFASYAFNKSHSAGYAILVMQTAWLKAYFPKEYMASVLTSYMGKTEKIVHYVTAFRREGVDILPPDINESGRDFTASADGVRFGFAGIRGVGDGVGDAIMAEREAGGPFKSLHDFVDRVDSSQANRRVVEALIMSGAFDSTGYTRMQLMGFVDKTNPANIIDAAAKRQKERASGQFSMFDMFGDVEGSGFKEEVPPPDGVEWDRSMKLKREHEVLGLYVSDHPLRPYEYALNKARDYSLSDIEVSEEFTDSAGGVHERFKVPEGKVLRFAGMVSSVQKKTTKNGDPMAVVTLEDMEGETTLVIFPKLYKKCAEALTPHVDEETGEAEGDVFVKVSGKLERSDRGNQIICMEVEPLVLNEKTNRPKVVEVMMPASMLTRGRMDELGSVLARYPGLDHVELRVEAESGDTMRMELPCRVDARNMVLLAEVTDIVGLAGHICVA